MYDSVVNPIITKLASLILKDIRGTEKVYHYTSASSLISMIENGEFWITHSEFMNDMTENEYAFDVLAKTIKRTDVSPYNKSEFLEKVRAERQNLLDSCYIQSFSLNSDSIHLWNNYGKNDGYNLGFDFDKIATWYHKSEFRTSTTSSSEFTILPTFGKVLYRKQEQEALVQFCNETYLRFARMAVSEQNSSRRQMAEKQLQSVWKTLMTTSFLIKQEEHSSEAEFRVMILPLNESTPLSFRSINGIVAPFIKIRPREGLLPINSVKIGPKIDDKVARLGLSYLLKEKYGSVVLSRSQVRLRF